MALGFTLVVVKVVAKPLLQLQKKRHPEPSKSPETPKASYRKLDGWEFLGNEDYKTFGLTTYLRPKSVRLFPALCLFCCLWGCS